jgi:hypothetical protein
MDMKGAPKKMKNRYRDTARVRAFSLLHRIQSVSWTAVVVTVLALLATSSSGPSSIWALFGSAWGIDAERQISSTMMFPQVEAVDNTNDMLSAYPVYLKFVLEVGKRTDATTAHRLENTYNVLRQRYPEAAANFLRGLRFEMVQKLELTGVNPSSVTTNTPEMRRWVGKFMRDWWREADEHFFRAVADSRPR